MKKYVIRMGSFYLNHYSIDKESIATDFITDIDFDSNFEYALIFSEEEYVEAYKLLTILKRILNTEDIFLIDGE